MAPETILFRIEDNAGGPPGPNSETTACYVIEILEGPEIEISDSDKYHDHYFSNALHVAKRIVDKYGLIGEIECWKCRGRKKEYNFESKKCDGPDCKECSGTGRLPLG